MFVCFYGYWFTDFLAKHVTNSQSFLSEKTNSQSFFKEKKIVKVSAIGILSLALLYLYKDRKTYSPKTKALFDFINSNTMARPIIHIIFALIIASCKYIHFLEHLYICTHGKALNKYIYIFYFLGGKIYQISLFHD